MTTADHVDDGIRLLGLKRRHIERAVIVGSTRLAELTCEVMADSGLSVVMVEEDRSRSTYLANNHPKALVINGDPTDPDVLGELELGESDVLLALSGWDEVNMMSCLVAKAMGVGMAVARFFRTSYVGLLAGLGIDAAVSARLMAASAILRFVRQGRVEQVVAFSDTDAEAIEIEVTEGAEAVGKTVLDLGLPQGVTIGGISRSETTFVPDGSTMIRAGDHIIFFALPPEIGESTRLFTSWPSGAMVRSSAS
jgi:trk system potassium uptake protein TrkA